MSDRIAVMSDGRLQQLGSAREIYETPHNRFVADFIGETNLFEVTVSSLGDRQATCTLANGQTLLCDLAEGSSAHQRGHLSIRPERMALHANPRGPSDLSGQVVQTIFVGTDVQTIVALPGGLSLVVRTQNSDAGRSALFERGAQVFVSIEPGAARLLVD